ncbi:MAG TPA: hypothetical protein VIF62_29145 [Labilithrix sp.]
MNALRIASGLFVVVTLVACGGSTVSVGSDKSASTGDGSSGGGSTDAACTTDADCGSGFECGFASADACTAKGKCFDVRGIATCAAYSAGCACDGTEINVACSPLPNGYATKPLLHAGKCDGGAADAGPKSCTTDAECDSGWGCEFPDADACAAKGTCFDLRGIATCASYSAGCACDGTEVNVACLPVPGYTSKPLAHTGSCK